MVWKITVLAAGLFWGASDSARAESGFFVDYGQSRNVWNVYNDVKGAQKDLFKINRILNENFGQYDTAFTRLGSDFDLAHPNRAWARAVRLELSIEAAALGLVQNPVVPELVAAATAVSILRTSVTMAPAEGWSGEVALLYGWGIERRLSAVSTDLIESIPFQKDNVRLWGVDFAAAREWKREESRIALRAAWKGTSYNGLDAQTSVALDRKLRSFTQWWEGRADYSWGSSPWSVHGVVGSHPLPENVLPRVWDRVANTNAWRELGAMSGAGLVYTKAVSAKESIRLTGGVYAGYLGFFARWALSARTHFELSTFGIENSSAYRTLGQRVYNFASYLAF